eukprot:NODE_2890_length_728_cov_214.247423_g2039_i0.p6 GENE.NODE_2890_length_728_cov_214.247423_g2039_i0~~NODE_2890_length_728_cov_214.247423_g2039_i0.p6  ORF type:complete len:67 (+),score=0.28 NODE_2890_length_728_cov_214.247423_g2039_i0:417-617(+)
MHIQRQPRTMDMHTIFYVHTYIYIYTCVCAYLCTHQGMGEQCARLCEGADLSFRHGKAGYANKMLH